MFARDGRLTVFLISNYLGETLMSPALYCNLFTPVMTYNEIRRKKKKRLFEKFGKTAIYASFIAGFAAISSEPFLHTGIATGICLFMECFRK
jgi:hypothetical protein